MEGKRKTQRSGAGMGKQSSPKMRNSCNVCASAKRGCDGKSCCSLCNKRGIPCVYSEPLSPPVSDEILQRQKSGPKGATNPDGVGGADAMVEPNPNFSSSSSQQRPRASSSPSFSENVRHSKVPKSREPPPLAASDQPAKKLARRAEPPPAMSSIAGWQRAAKRHPHPKPATAKVTQPSISARKAPEAIKVASRPPNVSKPVKTKKVNTEKTVRTKEKKSKAASGMAPRVPLGPSVTPAIPVAPKITSGPLLPAPAHVAPIAAAPLPSISPRSPVCYAGPSGTPTTPSLQQASAQAPAHRVESNVGGTGRSAGDAVKTFAAVSVRQLELPPAMAGVETAKETAEKTGEAARRVRESISATSETTDGIMAPGSESTCSVHYVQWPDDQTSMLDDITDEDMLLLDFPDVDGSSNGNGVQGARAGMEAYAGAPRLGGAHLNSRATIHMYYGGVEDSAKVGTGVALGDCRNGIVVDAFGVGAPSRVPVGTHVGTHRPTSTQPQHQQRSWAVSCSNLRSRSPAVIFRHDSACINSFRQEQRQHSRERSLRMGNSNPQSQGYGQGQDATSFPSVDGGGGDLVVSWTEAATEAAVASMVDAFGEDLRRVDFSHHRDCDGDGGDGGVGGETKGSEDVNRRVLWVGHRHDQQ